ncbi:hypothetical protein [Mycobacterium neglectum]|uniref:hypothetical protein n=1 Tax=Mycobacterium neglectum TaxID=242737 RepID=UPI000BFED58A|nr:hypothetical protein [Mycobacterium neglectum]
MKAADRPLPPASRGALIVGAAAVLLLVWQLFWAATDFLPPPLRTLETAGELLADPATYEDLGATRGASPNCEREG